MIPAYRFLQRDAAKSASEQSFLAAVLSTRRFWRSEKSQIMFEVAPGDYCLLERREGFRSILAFGEVLRIDGDTDDSAYMTMWIWLTAGKWKLPRLNPERPYNPPKPVPVRNVPYQAPSLGAGKVSR